MNELKEQAVQREEQAELPAYSNIEKISNEIDASPFRDELRAFFLLLSEPGF